MGEEHIQFTPAVQQGLFKILRYIRHIHTYIHTHTERFPATPLTCTPGICRDFKEALQQAATAALLQQLTELTAL